jgi:DNA-binding NarL/FixJ family response regulator
MGLWSRQSAYFRPFPGVCVVTNIGILLVDDHELVREGFRLLIAGMSGVSILGEAANGRDAVKLIEKLQPNIVLLDIVLPLLNGIDVAVHAKQVLPSVRILMVSAYADEQYVLQALGAGASGYLLKDGSTKELEFAIRAVSRGETYLSPKIANCVVNDRLCQPDTHGNFRRPLTLRQREILQLIAEGHTTKDIASILNVSHKTVETHRARLMESVGVHDIAGLVRYAVRIKCIRVDNVA